MDVTVTTPSGTSPVNAPSDQYTYNGPPTVTGVTPNNGTQAGTNTVSVAGTGFVSGSTTVNFGSNAGTSVSVASSTSLTVTVPAGTGTVNVTVTTPNGTSAINAPSDDYTYNAPPTVTSVVPNNGPQAGGNTVTVNGSGFSGVPTVDFGSTPGVGVANVTASSLTVSVPAGTGVVSVSVTTASGGTSTSLANAYTYNPPPTVTSVVPNNGPQVGGNTVTVNGSGFSGVPTVTFGSNAGTSVSVTSSTSLTVVVPAGTGTVAVTVSTTTGGSSTPLANAYTYNGPPTVTGVTPNNGTQAGTNTVSVAGTGFVSGSTTVNFGSNAGTSVSVASSTSLTVTVPAGTGTVNVTVTTPNGTSAINAPSDDYTYNAPPTVTSVVPNNGPQAGGNTVTVNGSGFSGVPTVDFGSTPGVGVANVTASSLTVSVPAGTGVVSVSVTTASGGTSTSLANAYTYNPPPTVTSVVPNNGPQVGGNTVTVNGSGFSGVPTVTFGSNAGTSVSVTSSTSLTVVVPAGTGTVAVTVSTTTGGSSTPLANAYTYNGPPTVTGVTPNNGTQAGTNTVSVAGTGFVSGSTTVNFGSNAGTSVSVASSTSLTVTVPAGTGTVNVTVTTPNGTSAINAPSDDYTYNAPPTVTSVVPNNGPQAGGNTVTVNGSGFSGVPTVDFGSTPGVGVANVTASSLTVSVPAGTGVVSVSVTTASGGTSTSLANAYTYNPPPTVTSVVPNNGPQVGGNTVTVNGSGFSGVPTVTFGSNAGTSVSVTSSTSLTVVVPAGTGTVAVTVSTTTGGSSTPLANAYTYAAPAISLVKSVTSSGPYNAVGQTISYQFVATNTGNVTLSSVGITDTQAAPAGSLTSGPSCSSLSSPTGSCTGSTTSLAPGQSATFVATYTVTQADLTNGSVSDSATASGSPPSGPGVTSSPSTASVSTTAATSGGSVTLKKSTGLIGNYVDTVSGAHWNTNHDSFVNIYECVGTSYASGSCTGALTNAPIAVESTPAAKAGNYPSTGVELKVGTVGSSACGLNTSPVCSLVVVGSSGDSTDVTLSFAVPSVKVSKATNVLGNYVEKLTAKNFPIGDTIDAVECDSTVTTANLGQNCDDATRISGGASATGEVIGTAWSPAGLTMLVDGAYSDSAAGSCLTGGSCSVAAIDSTNSVVNALSGSVGMATPSVKVTKANNVLGNYVEKLTAKNFPIGDTIDAVECDSTVTTANLGQNCDDATRISGSASATGELASTAWSPAGLTMLVDGAYSDSAAGSCLTGGTCYVAALDSTNSAVNALSGSIGMATPTVTIAPATVANGNGKTITVTGKGFPINDTVNAVECDTAFSGSLNNCDTAKAEISGTAGATGIVVWSPTTKITVLTTVTSPAYADSSSPPATCAPGDSVADSDPCFVYTYDTLNPAISNTSPFSVG